MHCLLLSRGGRTLEAEDRGDERLQVGAVGRNRRHADGTGVITELLERERDCICVQRHACKIGSIVRSFGVSPVAFVTFVGREASLPPGDERIRGGGW